MQLVIIDVQDRILESFGPRPLFLHNVKCILRAFIDRHLPIIVTEQVPNRLGPTNRSLHEIWNKRPDLVTLIPKAKFSAADIILKHCCNTEKVALVGIETDICVLQSALELIVSKEVIVITDAVTSGRLEEEEVAFLRMKCNKIICLNAENFLNSLSNV